MSDTINRLDSVVADLTSKIKMYESIIEHQGEMIDRLLNGADKAAKQLQYDA